LKRRPKKSLSQNYLTDENISQNTASVFNIKPEDNILEIGAGQGALTKNILLKTKNLTVIEIDRNNCEILKNRFPELEIINGDFLEFDLNSQFRIHNSKFRVIGNIPYNITSEIIFKLIDNRRIIKDAQLMVQEEVARRLASKPGSKEYGIPSVLLQAFSEPELRFKVSRNCFYPKPNVDSRIIYIDFTRSRESEIADTNFFRKFVKASFSSRRKTLRNSLKVLERLPGKADFDFSRRAESISVDECIKLCNSFCSPA
jgi:16S rRNA (adenine1518-N6/adenine1519-N6)-dimethyltransferase